MGEMKVNKLLIINNYNHISREILNLIYFMFSAFLRHETRRSVRAAR